MSFLQFLMSFVFSLGSVVAPVVNNMNNQEKGGQTDPSGTSDDPNDASVEATTPAEQTATEGDVPQQTAEQASRTDETANTFPDNSTANVVTDPPEDTQDPTKQATSQTQIADNPTGLSGPFEEFTPPSSEVVIPTQKNASIDSASQQPTEKNTSASTHEQTIEPTLSTDITAGDALTVMTGRVTTIKLTDDDIASVRITKLPTDGNVTVNPNNTLALVLSDTDTTGLTSFEYEITYNNGSTKAFSSDLTMTTSTQAGGWGVGDFYTLETDSNDNLIIEHGDNHRAVHMSNSEKALSLSDIARAEKVDINDINGKWLAEHPNNYGVSEDSPLKPDAAMMLWDRISGENSDPNSNWLLLERGHDYGNLRDFGELIGRGADGESELHPMVIGAYGTGAKPVVHSGLNIYKSVSENIVIRDIDFEDASVQALLGKNILWDSLEISGHEVNVQNIDAFTLRNSSITDSFRDAPKFDDGDGMWNPSPDRISGIFIKNSEGVLIENSFFDHAGWGEGYDYNMDENYPQPPSMFSHNVYVQKDNLDVTFRDNVSMRGASFGAQIRPGGFIEDNVLLDNNAGINFYWGTRDSETGIGNGNFTLFADNLITSGAHKEVAQKEGALTQGVNHGGNAATLLDNIVTHLADPNNPDEQLSKTVAHGALSNAKGSNAIYDDTIIYNWTGQNNIDAGTMGRNPNENIEGLDTNTLNNTTIQKYAAEILGTKTATIDDLAEYLRNQKDGALEGDVTADTILEYFQAGFGISNELNPNATLNIFVPDELGDGIRWDNRLNWSEDYLPQDGQDVDLNGNWVYFGGTHTVDDLNLGSNGKLYATHGRLDIDGMTTTGAQGAEMIIDGAGQVWMKGYTDTNLLSISADGGRFANFGTVSGNIQIDASDNAQILLAAGSAGFDLASGDSLRIVGNDTKVGFDGDNRADVATLRLDEGSLLGFAADDMGTLGQIAEIRSGAFGDSPEVKSGVHLGNSHLSLDLSGIQGAYSATLIDVDMLVGTFGEISTTGLGGDRNATLQIDYDADTVSINISTKGNGSMLFDIKGTATPETNAEGDIWSALTKEQGIYSDALPDAEIDNSYTPYIDLL